MSTSVSRRVIFVKMKRARSLPKPKPPPRADDKLIGDAARASTPLLLARAAASPERWSKWRLAAAWAGGIAAFVGIVVVFVALAKPPRDTGERAPLVRSAEKNPGYSRSAGSGHSGTGGGAATTRPQAGSAEGFLSSPFRIRAVTPVTCSVKIENTKDSMREFSSCLQQAKEADATPVP